MFEVIIFISGLIVGFLFCFIWIRAWLLKTIDSSDEDFEDWQKNIKDFK